MEIIEVCEVLIINSLGQLLLQLRDNNPDISGPGKWGVIGGRKEFFETPFDCLTREIHEEIGLKLAPVLKSKIEDVDGDKLYRHYIYIAHCSARAEDLSLQEGQKIAFFDVEQIIKLDKVAWFERVYAPVIKELNGE